MATNRRRPPRPSRSTIGLVKELQQHGAAARTEVWHCLIDKVERHARAQLVGLGATPQVVDELAHAVTEKVWLRLAIYQPQPGVSFWAWVAKIVHHEWLDHQKRLKRRRAMPLGGEPAGSDSVVLPRDHRAESPSQPFGYRELIDRIEEFLAGLSATKADAWRLRKFDDMPYSEIATRLGMADGSVRSIVSRLDSQLRALLRQHGYDAVPEAEVD